MPPRPRQSGGICLIAMAVILLCQSCFGYNVKIVSCSYRNNYTYGQTFDLNVTVKNDGFSIGQVYFSPVLVHTETGIEKYPAASPVKRRFEPGETYTFTTQGWRIHDDFCPPPTGEYRVVLIMYDENDKELGRVYPDSPICINFQMQAKKIEDDKENENI